ncbi:heparan-alpha-glucosaminide N-acetyltransferase domain-containing protein [Nguyenibacter sp. L1]|uniref:heparan-alpha-glucosaminide N-acetyltransferase domain-containing protein n=1 Tax=Nguyenibacter sp. L1 TaxID=3049350 RepID=UPI002B48068D|nr:heparan-alpha-glucosaminide N-acetyltransferase domain-containing protein [Nguyenibacter sp. L1]WRH88827.1 heparan-alpha-glucosaminide N-acetyltransferase domain-containing protein [Nguyenibacter sp. L1]
MSRAAERLDGLDATRGAIMLLMALDHVGALVVRRHSVEFWGGAWTRYADTGRDVTQLLLRLASDLCAPGFFFWMGAGAALLAQRRPDWGAAQFRRHWLARGVLVLAVSQVIEVPAWIVGIAGDGTGQPPPAWPGHGTPVHLAWTVLSCLGGCMLVLGALHPLLRRPGAAFLLALPCLAATPLFLPPPDAAMRAESIAARLLLVPGQTGGVYVEYPLLPWLAFVLLGFAAGRRLAVAPARAIRAALIAGMAGIGVAMALRWSGIGSIRPPRDASWREFVNLIKYPPSLVYVLSMLGGNLCLFHLFSRLSTKRDAVLPRVLRVFGRAPLVFYVMHLWLFAVIGALFFRHGTHYAVGLGVWLAALPVLYRICARFGAWRRAAPAASWLQLV